MAESQLAHIEKRLDELASTTKASLQKTDDKLDLLLELTRQMAVFQSKQEHHSEKLQNLERSISELRIDLGTEIKKVDDKFMDLDKDKKTAITRCHDRINEVEADLEKSIEKGTEIHTDLDKHTSEVQTEISSRMSFVRGVMWVLGFVMIAAQSLAIKMYSDIETALKNGEAETSKINNKLHEMDRQFDFIIANVNSIKDKEKK